MKTGDNLALYVACYDDVQQANEDYLGLKGAEVIDDYRVVAAAVLSRDVDGEVHVKEHGTGDVAAGTGIGAVGGLVVGLFAPGLLVTTALGAGLGAAVGAIVKHHQEKKIGVDAEEYLPPGSSAVVVILDDRYLDRVETTLTKATKRVSKAIDSGDYDKVKKAIEDAGYDIHEAIGD